MGLLSYINNQYYSSSETQQGLLNIAEKIINQSQGISLQNSYFDFISPFINFHNIINSTTIKCGVLVFSSNYYRLLFSNNLSIKTFDKCISTKSFWDGTILTNELTTFSDSSLNPFYQLFDENDLLPNSQLFIQKHSSTFENDVIFFTINNTFADFDTGIFTRIFSFLDKNNFLITQYSNLNNDTLIYSAWTNDRFQDFDNSCVKGLQITNKVQFLYLNLTNIYQVSSSISDIDIVLIHRFFYFILHNLTVNPNICLTTDYNSIYFIYFSQETLDTELFNYQLEKILKNYIPNYLANNLPIEYFTFENNESIKNYLNSLIDSKK